MRQKKYSLNDMNYSYRYDLEDYFTKKEEKQFLEIL